MKKIFKKLTAMTLISAMIFSADYSLALAKEEKAASVSMAEETMTLAGTDISDTDILIPEICDDSDRPDSLGELPSGGKTEESRTIAEEGETVDPVDPGTVEEQVCDHDAYDTYDIIKPATLTANGSVTVYCNNCNEIIEERDISKPVTFAPAKSSYAYSGNAKEPAVKIHDADGILIDPDNYTLTYSNNTQIGTAKITIKFDGHYYKGTKSVTFKILPKVSEITSLTESKTANSIAVKWKKVTTKTNGYQLQYSTNSDFGSCETLTIRDNTLVSKTITGLKYGKTYYFRIRTFYQAGDKKYFSTWSATEKVKTYSKDQIAAIKVAQNFMTYAKTWDYKNMNKVIWGGKVTAFPYPQSIVFNYMLSKNKSHLSATPVKCTISGTNATITMSVKYRNYYAASYVAYYDLAWDMMLTGQEYSEAKTYQKLKEYISYEASNDNKPFTDKVNLTFKAVKKNDVWKLKGFSDETLDVILCRFVSASEDVANEE